MKEKSKRILILLLVMFLGCFSLTGCGKDKEKENENKENQGSTENVALYHDYSYCSYNAITSSEESIFLDGEKIYDCQSTGEYGCYVTMLNDIDYCNTTDSLIMITDNGKDYIYDYKNKKAILEVDAFTGMLFSDNGFIAYFVFEKDGKTGLASMEGKVVLEAKYDDVALGNPIFDGEYSMKNNVVAVEKDGKVGVLEITTGKEIVPFEYDYVRVYANNYILIKEDKITFTDLKLNTLVEGDYDDMVLVDDVLFVENDKVLSFYDLEGNKMMEDTVTIIKPYDNSLDRGFTAHSMDQYNEVITIEVYNENMEYDSCYNLHVKEKSLEKFDCSEMGE